MSENRTSWKTYLLVMTLGLVAVTIAGLLRYNWQIEAYRGQIMLAQGQQLGVSTMANGMFGSIIGAMTVGTVLMAVLVVTMWLTVDLKAGLIMAVLCLIPLTIFNFRVTSYLEANPAARGAAGKLASSYSGQIVSTFNESIIPVMLGLVIGFFIYRKILDQRVRDANRPKILSVAERKAQLEADLSGENARDAGQVPASVVAQGVPAANPMTATAAPATAMPAAAQARPVEKRATICRKCGASNVPSRTACLRCGSALTS